MESKRKEGRKIGLSIGPKWLAGKHYKKTQKRKIGQMT